MSRRSDPERKPQLLDDIVEYLLDKSLGCLTFRTVAEHLEVSTFTLVYHFGSKDQLLVEVVEAICDARRLAVIGGPAGELGVDGFFDSINSFWIWSLSPRNQALHRLQVEAATMAALSPSVAAVPREAVMEWHRFAADALSQLGVPSAQALVEGRGLADLAFGLQYDLMVSGDEAGATAAFEAALDMSRRRVHSLVSSAVRG